jgi:hypothetical protein
MYFCEYFRKISHEGSRMGTYSVQSSLLYAVTSSLIDSILCVRSIFDFHFVSHNGIMSHKASHLKNMGKKSKRIKTLEERSEKYQQVKTEFLTSWVKSSAPDVVAIFQINSYGFKARYEDYNSRQRVLVEQSLWHGTRLGCHIGKAHRLCHQGNCSICGITRTGFRLSKVGTRDPTGTLTTVSKFERFGSGLYFAPNASKSHDYTTENINCQDPGCRCHGNHAMLLCYVSTGRGYVVKQNMPDLREAPAGYDSVIGTVGDALAYPEVIVYDEAAVLPRYIVIYRP